MPGASRDAEIDRLIARTHVIDAVLRYASGVDLRDWALYRSAFTDEITVDFNSWSAGEAATLPADDWVAKVRGNLQCFDATQHISSNHVVTFRDADEATCVSYMIAHHVLITNTGDNAYTIGGYYTNQLRRGAEDWRIYDCKLTVTWRTGNFALFAIAAERMKALGG